MEYGVSAFFGNLHTQVNKPIWTYQIQHLKKIYKKQLDRSISITKNWTTSLRMRLIKVP